MIASHHDKKSTKFGQKKSFMLPNLPKICSNEEHMANPGIFPNLDLAISRKDSQLHHHHHPRIFPNIFKPTIIFLKSAIYKSPKQHTIEFGLAQILQKKKKKVSKIQNVLTNSKRKKN